MEGDGHGAYGSGEAADEAADGTQRAHVGKGVRTPTAEGSTVPADGPSEGPTDHPAAAPVVEIEVDDDLRRKIEDAPPAALRGREEDANPARLPDEEVSRGA